MTRRPEIILASRSPRREQLLRERGLRFRVVCPPAIPEKLTGAAPAVLAMGNARAKAQAVAARYPAAAIVGADTIVVWRDRVFGKPADRAEAARMLSQLVGRAHEVITGVCVVHCASETELTFHERTRVWMHALDEAGIQAYLATIQPLDKAGAYAIQEKGDAIVARIDGSYSNVMGLPMERLCATLAKRGWLPAG
jgi:septum formation protein